MTNEDEVFARYSAYYDLLYQDKDYHAEANYIASVLHGVGSSIRSLLEFGSGTGRHALLLSAQGFEILGVEGSETMVRAAEVRRRSESQERPAFNCVHGDIRTIKLDRSFDAVISLFHVVSYQTGNSDLLETFANAACHLPKGGVFLFDVWHGPAVLGERPVTRVKRVEDGNTKLTRIAEPTLDLDASIVTVRYTMLAESKADGRFATFQEEHRMRYLFRTEIELLATQAGFVVEWTEEFLTRRKPCEKTWGVAYLLRKS